MVTQYQVGDGIRDVLVDDLDELWVSYFDEGVYGGHPLSATGLCRFDTNGNLLWSAGSADISDCYALNVAGKTAWVHYYATFDVMRVEADDVDVWHTDAIGSGSLASINAHGAQALLVDSGRVLPIGTYGDPFAASCWSLGSDQLEDVQPVELDLPEALRNRPRVLAARVCRADRIYLLDGNDLYSGSMLEMS